ncbi:efflux RND transporter periplasmic adaptor subunit [Dickeya fangzhongdai]|uniref:efflux RND transporter periplasmic adaptor subunit n=1 Tax=Dickeya fangzhongdai TaxID=1778540 RepID=UPI000675FF0F|nr:efflux RND transporter periplasmic adaptor subunit [Dickeya fangzhongdai]
MNHHSQHAPFAHTDRHRSWKIVIVTVVVLALIVSLLWFWRASRNTAWGYAPGAPVNVVALKLQAAPVPDRFDALGNLRAVNQVTLASETAGRVTAIGFDSGLTVKAGAPLVQLDDAPERADLVAANAAAAFAQQQYQRAGKLAETGAISTEVLQQRQSERDRTAAQVMQLEARIRQKAIRAPFSGQLGLRQVDAGQYLNAGDTVATLTALDALYVDFTVPQQMLSRIRPGQDVDVISDMPDVPMSVAKVTAIEPQVGTDTRNATVRARLNNDAQQLRPGMYVTATVILPDTPDGLLVPATAIMTSSSGDTVIAVRGESPEKGGKAEFVPVATGRRLGDRVMITRGLKDGDVVVTEGQLRIQPGADVNVVQKPAAGAARPDAGKE